jgi:hypothetical protein
MPGSTTNGSVNKRPGMAYGYCHKNDLIGLTV